MHVVNRACINVRVHTVLQAGNHLVVFRSNERQALAKFVGFELAQLTLVGFGQHSAPAATFANHFDAVLQRIQFRFLFAQ